MPTHEFYVYENWTNTFAKVHRGSCPYCNDGKGFQGRGSSTPSGKWHGTYRTQEDALAAARRFADQHANRSVWEVAICGYCG